MRKRRQSGSALIEAAITLPMFALLLCGASDVSRTFFLSQVAITAARAGALHALRSDPHTLDLGAVEQAAASDAGGIGVSAKAERVCACSPEGKTSSCGGMRCPAAHLSYVVVHTSVKMQPFMHYPGMASPYIVRAEALIRVE